MEAANVHSHSVPTAETILRLIEGELGCSLDDATSAVRIRCLESLSEAGGLLVQRYRAIAQREVDSWPSPGRLHEAAE